MSAASDLWAAVVLRYDADGLIPLTNIRDRSATSINTTAGTQASQDTIDLFPIYAQADFDPTNASHVQAAVLGVIAMLWRRGGTSSSIEQVKWDEVYGDSGVIKTLRNVGARARIAPSSNSELSQSSEATADGQRIRPWSDKSLFLGNLPRANPAES